MHLQARKIGAELRDKNNEMKNWIMITPNKTCLAASSCRKKIMCFLLTICSSS